MKTYRSYCPQNLALEIFGDKWTLLIIRDLMFEGKRFFREFLQSNEKIASNILTTRLKSLEEAGIVYKTRDPSHKQKVKYLLTEKGIDLLPILIENARWSLKYLPVDVEDAKIAQELIDGGMEKIRELRTKLKAAHLPPPS